MPARLSAKILALLLLLTGGAASAARRPVHVSGVLNLNTATEAELRQLPGVGQKKAARIIERRTRQKFQSTDQLMSVKGFGRLTYRALKPHLAISGPTTIKRELAPATAAPAVTPAKP